MPTITPTPTPSYLQLQNANTLSPNTPPKQVSVASSKDAAANYNTTYAANQELQRQVATQNAYKASLAGQDPVIQAALSNSPYEQLLKENPAAAYYRSTGKLASADPTGFSAFQQSNQPPQANQGNTNDSSNVLNQIKEALNPSQTNTGSVIGSNGNPVTLTDSSGNPVQNGGSSASNSQLSPLEQQINNENQSLRDFVNSSKDTLNRVATGGTLPLNPYQQALLDSTKALYDRQIQMQQEANKNYEGGINIAEIASGRNMYASNISLGNVKAAVDSDLQKVFDIQTRQSQALSNMQQAFQDDDLTKIRQAYKDVTDAQNAITQNLIKIQDRTLAFQKEQQDRIDQQKKDYFNEVQKPLTDMLTEAASNGAPLETLQKIKNAPTVEEALTLAGEYMQKPPGGVIGEYMYYLKDAKMHGQTPVDFQTYQNIDANRKAKIASAGVTPSTQNVLNNQNSSDTNQATQVPYFTAKGNATQQQAAGFAVRAYQANKIFDELLPNIQKTGNYSYALEQRLPNILQPSWIQQQQQAERNFVNAVLRRESGAAISPSEFDSAAKQYFPQPGDSQETLDQKKVNRDTTYRSIVAQAGTAIDFKDIDNGTSAQIIQNQQKNPLNLQLPTANYSNPLNISL